MDRISRNKTEYAEEERKSYGSGLRKPGVSAVGTLATATSNVGVRQSLGRKRSEAFGEKDEPGNINEEGGKEVA